jgi:RNA polymerase-binding transcription factor DksA
MNNQTKRYTDADLAEFKALLDKKLDKAERQLALLNQRLKETAETKDNQGDWMDDSSNSNDIDMLQTMANRQTKHILDLRTALQRVHNKSYGICVISGELIDKKRLMAVPTTTKSLAAKLGAAAQVKKSSLPQKEKSQTNTPKIISKIIRKPTPKKEIPKNWELEEDLDLEIDNNDDLSINDLDTYLE